MTPLALIILGFILLAALIVFVAGMMPREPRAPMDVIEPQDLIDPKEPCSWCQKEQAIKAQPHESHGICQRHKELLLAQSKAFSKSIFA